MELLLSTDYREVVDYLIRYNPVAFYGLFATVAAMALFLLLWGFNVLSNGLITTTVQALKPAVWLCLALTGAFVTFIITVVMRGDLQAAGDPFATAGTPAVTDSAADRYSTTPLRASTNPADSPDKKIPAPEKAIVNPDAAVGKKSDNTGGKTAAVREKKNETEKKRPVEFSLNKVRKTLESLGFLEKPRSGRSSGGQKAWLYDRRFGRDAVEIELKAEKGNLRRITFHLPADAKKQFPKPVDELLLKFFGLHFNPLQAEIDGLIHAPDLSSPRARKIGDFYCVKAVSKKPEFGCRFIIIHKDDPRLNPGTPKLAEKQTETDWNAYRSW